MLVRIRLGDADGVLKVLEGCGAWRRRETGCAVSRGRHWWIQRECGPVLRREAGVCGKRWPVDAACAVRPVLWLACTAGDRRVL